ncbi:MAG: hypothetical protein Q9214_001753 [Letrouitia sp. 1 TL-2023]
MGSASPQEVEKRAPADRGSLERKSISAKTIYTNHERRDAENSSSEGEDITLDHGRTAIYDYASEKSISHEESKLFYQRHPLESSQPDPYTRGLPNRSRTLSLNYDGGYRGRGQTLQKHGQYGTKDAKERKLGHDQDKQSNWPRSLESKEKLSLGSDGRCQQHDVVTNIHNPDAVQCLPSEDIVEASQPEVPLTESDIHPELREMSIQIKKVLDLRHKYIKLSLQGPRDNPKDQPGWNVYPEPPKPVWIEEEGDPTNPGALARGLGHRKIPPSSPASSSHQSWANVKDEHARVRPAPSPKQQRKPGHDIGTDFDLSHFEPLPGEESSWKFKLDEGSVYQVFRDAIAVDQSRPEVHVPTLREYYIDLNTVKEVSEDGPIKSFAFRELQILDGKFNLHALENSYAEIMESKSVPHRDFYNVRKVDTHVHHSASMNSKHLLRFIKSKIKKSADDIVMFRDGKELTLKEVFESLKMTAYDLSIDTLDTHAHTDSFHRFDKFNLKYNPVGSSRLRDIFLKTDNHIKGRYLAELTREVMADLENSKYQMVEWRVSIYGRAIDEWDKLAAWVVDNKLVSHNVRWLIQVPRLYYLYKEQGLVQNFEQLIINIFQPLYEVTQNPASHPKLHAFLHRVIGFDSVDDESRVERRYYKKFPRPKDWNFPDNPMYNYWIYYLWANITPLNHWRQKRGFGTFVLRPHCGEAGDVEHLQSAVLCCHSISHGLLLRKASLLQYIFYLDQIGIAMSPLSNNALFLAYDRNPFPVYFRRGLNVSLSTDDPLQFAYTKEPLIEEYSVAAQICKLSAVDMCELARHSVMQSGFEYELKQRWLGPDYHLPGVQGNNMAKTNVPNLRHEFRYNTLKHERDMIARYANAIPIRSPSTHSLVQPEPQVPLKALPLRTIPYPSPILPAQKARVSKSQSHHELHMLDAQLAPVTEGENWTYAAPADGSSAPASRQPRIFPGVVHQRTRKRSLRQSSGSETDLDATGSIGLGLSGSGVLESRSPTITVAEEEADGDGNGANGA